MGGRYMKINFLFSESVTGNQLILMYYWVRGREAVAAERATTAVLIGEAIYYSWRLWQLLKEGAEGYQAGEATIKKKKLANRNCSYKLLTAGNQQWMYLEVSAAISCLYWWRRPCISHVFLSALSAAYFLPCVILPLFWGVVRGIKIYRPSDKCVQVI